MIHRRQNDKLPLIQRGVFRPRLKDLIQMNTPRVVLQESKKAFRAIFKRNDLEAAMGALSNLKGVGPAMASGTLSSLDLKKRPSSKKWEGKLVSCENSWFGQKLCLVCCAALHLSS